MGRVVSIDVAPADAIGASIPKYLLKIGAKSRLKISRIIFTSKAKVPMASPENLVISTPERL